MPNDLKQSVERIINWTKLKCRIQAGVRRSMHFKERDIWWAHLGENIGSEQNGKDHLFVRPVLIVKTFNADQLWILPMTTTDKIHEFLFPTRHGPDQRTSQVSLSQIRTISSKRLIKHQRVLPHSEFNSVRERLRNMLT